MSVRELDKNKDKFVGIEFPLGRSVTGFFNKTKTLQEQTKSNIRNLLLTNKGERVMQPTFGSDLQRLLFEQYSDDLRDRIEESIREALGNWLPYVIVNEVFVIQNEGNPNLIEVSLEYSISIQPDSFDTITFNFTLGE
jgi:hypothetical protein|tara:strand:+ start:89 stop:502 length:414 start_codon:yes stop_codon:yes gene_type:complete